MVDNPEALSRFIQETHAQITEENARSKEYDWDLVQFLKEQYLILLLRMWTNGSPYYEKILKNTIDQREVISIVNDKRLTARGNSMTQEAARAINHYRMFNDASQSE